MGIVQNLRGKVRGREDESCEIESAAWRNLLRVRVRWRRVAFWFSALDRHLESSSRKINNARSETSQNDLKETTGVPVFFCENSSHSSNTNWTILTLQRKYNLFETVFFLQKVDKEIYLFIFNIPLSKCKFFLSFTRMTSLRRRISNFLNETHENMFLNDIY